MRLTSILAGGLLWVMAFPATAQTVTGELRCAVKGGVGFIVYGGRAASCTYRRPGQPTEFYTGQTGTIGVDLGLTNAFVVTYKVLSADALAPAGLQGDFAGPAVAVAGNVGLAGNVLVGGAAGATLIPVPNLSTTAFTGFNVAAGLGQLHLQFAAVEQLPEHTGRRRRAPRAVELQ